MSDNVATGIPCAQMLIVREGMSDTFNVRGQYC